MNTYWWFRPSMIALFAVMPITVLAFAASDEFYLQYGAFNAITDGDFFLAWLSILGFATASWFAESMTTTRGARSPHYLRESNFRVLIFALAAVATAAAVVFLAPFVTRPALVMSSLRGDPGSAYIVRDMVEQIPGITSWENLFGLVVVLLMLKPRLTGRPRTAVERRLLIFILTITALKVILHTERIALIEILIPLCLCASAQRKRSKMWSIAPIVGVFALFLFFTGTEYLRSWVSFYADKSSSLWDFALHRMLGYYITAINNGAFIYGERHSYFFPVMTGGWFWHLPVPGLADAVSAATGVEAPTFEDTQNLLAGLNIEFNNTSGLFAPIIDFGPVFGVCIWFALGFCSGRLYRRFVDGDWVGLILFPTWYVGVLEIPRIFYWGDPRYFPALVVSLSIIFIVLFLLPRNNRWGPVLSPRFGGFSRDRKKPADLGPSVTATH